MLKLMLLAALALLAAVLFGGWVDGYRFAGWVDGYSPGLALVLPFPWIRSLLIEELHDLFGDDDEWVEGYQLLDLDEEE